MEFTRGSLRHEMAIRRTAVSAVTPLSPTMVRITVTGPELETFASAGPADHVKLFFPDPASGILTTPILTAEGINRPADGGVMISRDYTPRAFRLESLELDLDFVLHGTEGPASAWATAAAPGDALGVAGPRGSRLVPDGASRVVIVADETALPAAARWLELLPPETRVTALFDVADDSLEGYFGDQDLDAEWVYRGSGDLEESLRSLGPIDDSTFVFLAGEANALTPLRRYLRHELELPPEQVSASGYWRRGVTNLDHHAPLDPSDPD